MPATFVPGTSYVEHYKTKGSSNVTVDVEKVKKAIRKYEKKHRVIVAIYNNPNGYHGPGCIDPTKVKRWHFHAGETYVNSDHLQRHFRDRWDKGKKICNWKEQKKNGHWWVHGTQENCENVDIWIPITVVLPKPKKPVIEVKSYEVFWSKFVLHKTIQKEDERESERVVTTPGHYTCPVGWELVNGSTCKNCPPPQCEAQAPIVTNIETINDMEASANGHHHTRYISFEVFPAPGESLSDLEVALRVDKGEVFGNEAEFVGGHKFRQLYESPSETGTETYWGWARSKVTGLTGESEHKTFPIIAETTF